MPADAQLYVRVLVVKDWASQHNGSEERGLTTATGLLAILDHIRPEVIFLGCPLASFESYLSGAHATLEPTAVVRYRELYPAVELIPVDAPTPDASLFADFRDLISRVALTGPEYDMKQF